jgi:hypothetical protein
VKLVLLVVVAASCGCSTLSPAAPRFVQVFEQHTDGCRIQVVRDTRSQACFVGFHCGRQNLVVVAAAPEVCIP